VCLGLSVGVLWLMCRFICLGKLVGICNFWNGK
jgi:hypothetical protein